MITPCIRYAVLVVDLIYILSYIQEDFLPAYHKKGRCRSDGPGCSKEDLVRLGYADQEPSFFNPGGEEEKEVFEGQFY